MTAQNTKKKMQLPAFEILFILAGEVIASALTVLVFFLIGRFDYTVVTGCVLAIAVVIANLLILSISVNRAIDRVEEARGTREMTEEESAAFAAEHKGEVEGAMKLSFYLRTLMMFATLLAAFLIGVFNVIATLVPMLLWRPLLSVAVAVKPKFFPENQQTAQPSDTQQAEEETSGDNEQENA